MSERVVMHTFSSIRRKSDFNVRAYSMLKFGSDWVARIFGKELADRFYATHRDMLKNERCVVIPSPLTCEIDIASTILGRHFVNALNDHCNRDGLEPVQWTVMHRDMSYVPDYAAMGKEQRESALGGDRLYLNKEFVEGKSLIFVDDVIITGTHERKLQKFMEAEGLKNRHVFCYYAAYIGDTAAIESRLNATGIKNVFDYMQLSGEPGFHLVVRGLRIVLEAPIKKLRAALMMANNDLIYKLYHGAISKGYDKIYPEAFAELRAAYDDDMKTMPRTAVGVGL